MTYQDITGADVVLPSADYLATDEGLDAAFGESLPAGRWTANAVRIRYRAGYVTPPAPLIAAVLLMVGDLYRHRESQVIDAAVRVAVANPTVDRLLAPYRVYSL